MVVKKQVSNEEYKRAWENNDNQGVINAVLKRYSHMLNREELKSCGMMGLWRAMQYHDYSYKRAFTTSLHIFVRFACAKEAKKKSRHQTLLNFHPTRSVAERDKYSDKAIIDEWKNVYLQEEIDDMLHQMEELDGEDRKVLKQRYLEKKSLRDIADENGYSKQTARMKILRAVDNFKEQAGVLFLEETKSTT